MKWSGWSSFQYAIDGIRYLFVTQPHFKFHVFTAGAVIFAGIFLEITRTEWISIFLCIGLVMGTEALNTAIEVLCDRIYPEHDPQIKIVKDVAAGAVLITALAAAVTGLFVFIPRIYTFLTG